MTASYTVSGNNVTVRFSYTGGLQTVRDTATMAAKFFWDHSLEKEMDAVRPSFDSLTDQQKLDIIDTFILGEIRKAASMQEVIEAEDLARRQAIEVSKTKFI